MIAVVKLGAVAGMLNYNQRGNVIDHSLGVLEANVLILDPDAREALDSASESSVPREVITFDDIEKQAEGKSESEPSITATLPASTKAFYIFTSGTTGMPKASVMSHFRWLTGMSGIGGMGVRLRHDDTMYACLPLYHNNALTVSLSSVLGAGACLAIGRSFSASKFWDDVIRNRATAFCYIGELCRYLLAQPEKDTDRKHSVRVAVGNGMRAEIWDEFKTRFGIERIVEFYAASESNLAFINIFNLNRTAGFCPLTYKIVEYDGETGDPVRDDKGRVQEVKKGEAGAADLGDQRPHPLRRVHRPEGHREEDDHRRLQRRRQVVQTPVTSCATRASRTSPSSTASATPSAGRARTSRRPRWRAASTATPRSVSRSCFGVEIPDTDGKAGMAAVTLKNGDKLDGQQLAEHLYGALPSYALPLFIRVVESLEQTSTFKTMKVELREQGYSDTVTTRCTCSRASPTVTSSTTTGTPTTSPPPRRRATRDVSAESIDPRSDRRVVTHPVRSARRRRTRAGDGDRQHGRRTRSTTVAPRSPTPVRWTVSHGSSTRAPTSSTSVG